MELLPFLVFEVKSRIIYMFIEALGCTSADKNKLLGTDKIQQENTDEMMKTRRMDRKN